MATIGRILSRSILDMQAFGRAATRSLTEPLGPARTHEGCRLFTAGGSIDPRSTGSGPDVFVEINFRSPTAENDHAPFYFQVDCCVLDTSGTLRDEIVMV